MCFFGWLLDWLWGWAVGGEGRCEVNEYADRLADAVAAFSDKYKDFGNSGHYLEFMAMRAALEAYRNQPQETHQCEGCERRERETDMMLAALGWIAGEPTMKDPVLIAREALEAYNDGREAKA